MLVAAYVQTGERENLEWSSQQTSLIANWALDGGLFDGGDVELMELVETESVTRRVLRYAMRAPEFSEVWVVRLDRLGNNARVVGEMLELARVHGTRVRSMTEDFDSESPAGRQMVQLLAMYSEQQTSTLLADLAAAADDVRRGDD